MLDLNELSVFIRVVDEGSFTGAGKVLGMPKSRVSRMVADLEDKLGARLLQRTTRQLSLTEVGAAYYNRCRHLVVEILDTHEMIADREENPQGILRIASPMNSGTTIMGRYASRFQALYPDIRVELVHYDESVNLIQEGFDVGLFQGEMPDSTLIGRQILDADSVLCASPSYLKKIGYPQHPRDIIGLDCIKLGTGPQDQVHELVSDSGESCSISLRPKLITNTMDTALGAILQGGGIGSIPYLLAIEYILTGQLVPIFHNWQLKPVPVTLAYPSRQYLPRKVRVFIDFIVEEVDKLETMLHENCSAEEMMAAFRELLEFPDMPVS